MGVNSHTFGFPYMGKKEVLSISLKDAKIIIQRGLEYFVGKNAEWAVEYDDISSWLTDNKHKGLLCYGQCGRGKTLICENILPAIFRHYLHLNLLKFDGYSINQKRSLLQNAECSVLIDDFGVEDIGRSFGESHSTFSEFISLAEKRKQLIILTTNLNLDEIANKYGERTLDRLKSLTHPVLFKGESFRK